MAPRNMHRALSLPEIVSHIIAHVDSKGTLAILARTSSIVSDCALDKLWYTVDSVILLARCMPPDVWDEIELFEPYQAGPGVGSGNGPRGEYFSQLAFTDHPRVGDWLGERFRSYARRVRHLSIKDHVVKRERRPIRRSSSMPDISPNLDSSTMETHLFNYQVTASLHPDVLTAWSSYSESITAVFPNLSHLRWVLTDRAESQVALNMCMPSLRNLTLASIGSRHPDWARETTQVSAAMDILRSAMNAISRLEELDLFGEYPALSTYDLSPMAVLSWPSLQCLRTFRCSDRLPSSIMRHIASISGLQSFIGYPCADTSFQNLPHVFPAVLELRILGTSLGHLCDMISAVQSPSIITMNFSLATSGQLVARRVGDLLQIIEGHPSSQSLRELVITSFRVSLMSLRTVMQLGTNLALGDIRPPLGIRHLRHINLGCFTVAGDVADGFALELLHAWPELEELYLGPHSQTLISLSDFVEALRTRPALRRVPFEVVVHPWDTVPETHGFMHHNLKGMRLNLESLTTIHNRAVVAQFLNATFPNLEQYGVPCTDRSVAKLIWTGQTARLAGPPWTLDEYEAYLLQVAAGLEGNVRMCA